MLPGLGSLLVDGVQQYPDWSLANTYIYIYNMYKYAHLAPSTSVCFIHCYPTTAFTSSGSQERSLQRWSHELRLREWAWPHGNLRHWV